MNDKSLVPAEPVLSPALPQGEDWTKANHIADLCKQIVQATAINVDGRKHIPIEAWQSIAAAWGCTARTDEPYRVEGGLRCKATLTRDSDGMVLSTAYGFVGDDEPLWANRKQYAQEGMVQTRATSRVCAQKFRFIPVLMKIPDLSTTPYEEMQDKNVAAVKKATPGEETIHGKVSEYYAKDLTDQAGKKFTLFGARIGTIGVWTKDADLGRDLSQLNGVEVQARVVKSTKSYRLIDIDMLRDDGEKPEEQDDINMEPSGNPF